MLNERVKKLEKKHVRNTEVCIVMPKESKENALRRAQIKLTDIENIYFIYIILV